jgi:hypothetical protein
MRGVLVLCLMIAQVGFALEIEHKLDNESFKRGSEVYLTSDQQLTLRVALRDARSIKWYQIIPNTQRFYKNANHPWEKNAYKWVGYGKIDYSRVEIKAFGNKSEVMLTPEILEANRPRGNSYYHSRLGSFWFEVEATLRSGERVQTKGIKDIGRKGLSPKVFRVSYIEDRSYIGYLTSFYNVPGIFGSMPYQSRNYIGVDCADVLIATSKVMNKEKNEKNYNVVMLVDKFKTKAKAYIKDGTPNKKLRWGKDFAKGDFIAVKYHPKGRYAHIGMLYKDINGNALLDREDLIINAGPNALHHTALEDGAFDGEVVILENGDL